MHRILALALSMMVITPLHTTQAQTTEQPATATPEQLSALDMNTLLERLSQAERAEADILVPEIQGRWSRSGSDSVDLLLQRGNSAMEKGAFDRALSHYSRLVAFAPEFAEGYNARATAYFATGDHGFAIADLYHVIRLEPRHFNAIIGLAILLEEISRPAEALKAYRRAHDLYPANERVPQAIERLEKELEGLEA